jgi:hypothetical protein
MIVNWFRFQCRRARRLARLGAAGCLTESERAWLTGHAGVCSDCRYYAAELHSIRQQLQAWEETQSKCEVPAAFSAQWQAAIQAEARSARQTVWVPHLESGGAGWLGFDRAVPVSLVLIWLVIVGIHLNTPPVSRADAGAAVPTLDEVRVVMEWLMTSKEAV